MHCDIIENKLLSQTLILHHQDDRSKLFTISHILLYTKHSDKKIKVINKLLPNTSNITHPRNIIIFEMPIQR